MGFSRPGFAYFVIETHYDNHDLIPFNYDNSGIRIYYTPILRQHDAAMITLGDPFATLNPIPPQSSFFEYEVFLIINTLFKQKKKKKQQKTK